MRLKLSVKYQLQDMKKSIIIFYLIVALTTIGILLLSCIPDNQVISVKGRLSGPEVATALFLLVAGMNSFKEVFHMFLQNSISRKTLFVGRLVSVGIISLGMALIDSIIGSLLKLILSAGDSFIYKSSIEIMYALRYNTPSSGTQMFIEGTLLLCSLYAAFMMMGYFITILYYRMSKGVKITVSIGVPVLLFIVLPIVDAAVFNNGIERALESFITFAMGFSNGGANPYYAMMTLLMTFAIFSGISWLLVKKAPMKA